MFLILTVLYNKTTFTSDTLQGIIKSAGLLNEVGARLRLHDNSVNKMDSESLINLSRVLKHVDYVHTPQNLPLSEIYNTAIEQGLSMPQVKYLMLLDHDSKIDINFFKKAIEAAAGKHALMIPIVKNQGVIRSPMISYVIKTSVFSKLEPGSISSKNMVAINSGMIISFDYLRATGFKYDKRLNNYGTDNYFMKYYSARCATLFILDYTFDHSLSFFDSSDINKKLEVFSQNKSAFLIINSDNLFNYSRAIVYNILSSIKNAVKYKTLKFLK